MFGMDDDAFRHAADATLDRIGLALDGALETSGAEFDWELADGILTIVCGDESRIIVNRHVPNREIWVAAKSGGHHFRAQGGHWRDTRTGDELGSVLVRLLRTQAHALATMPELPAP